MKQRDGGTRTRVSSRSVDRPHTARPAPEGAAPRGGQHLAAVLERSPDVLFRLDRDLRHLFVSGNLSLLGRQRPEELLGKTAREAGLPEEAAALLEQAARRALETGEAQQADYPLAGAVLRSRLIPELGEDGTVQSLIGITEDVTELRRAERHAAFVSALGETLSLITDPDEIARTVTRAVGEHLACHRCYFGEIDEVEGIVVVHPDWASDGAPSVAGRYRLTDLGSPELWRAVQGRRIAIEDVATDPLTRDVAAKYEAMQVRALANAGFASEGRWVVQLTVNHASPRSWREDELALLETLAARTWPLVLRARSEKALRGSEARWRFALQAARMVAWESDLSTRRTILSDSAAEVVGLRDQRVVESAEAGLARIHPDDRKAHLARVLEALERGDGYTSRVRVIRPDDGRVIWVEDRGRVMLDEAGKPVRVSGLLMDVTDKVTAEQQAHRLASVLAATPDFVAITDIEGRLLHLNRAGRRTVGLPEAPDAPLPLARELYPRWVLERLAEEWLPTALREGSVSGEAALHDARGREIQVSFALLAHRDEAGNVEFFSAVVRDISERKKVEEALRDADRRKDEFLAMLAHELRNPLAPIRSAVEILKLRLGDDPKVQWPSDVIDRQHGSSTTCSTSRASRAGASRSRRRSSTW